MKVKKFYLFTAMKVLLHACCAICLTYPYKRLMEKDYEISVYWYNPNIHPYMEYKAREEALRKYARLEEINVIYGEYDFIEYLKSMLKNVERPYRCINCYEYRLEKVAKYAKENGFDAFTTTLLVSHHQYHNEIKKIGERLAEKYDISFYYEDFRKGWSQGKAIAKMYSLYSQKYCGCLISEYERFGKH